MISGWYVRMSQRKVLLSSAGMMNVYTKDNIPEMWFIVIAIRTSNTVKKNLSDLRGVTPVTGNCILFSSSMISSHSMLHNNQNFVESDFLLLVIIQTQRNVLYYVFCKIKYHTAISLTQVRGPGAVKAMKCRALDTVLYYFMWNSWLTKG